MRFLRRSHHALPGLDDELGSLIAPRTDVPVIFDNEIYSAGLEGLDDIKVDNIKFPVDRFVFPDVHRVIVSLAIIPSWCRAP